VLDRSALAALGVDDAVVDARRELDGADAVAFLAALPALSTRWERHFGLTGARLAPGGALSAVLSCTRVADGRRVMLKLVAPHARSGAAEAAALAAWGGVGACALLAASDDGAALVLEAIEPGSAVEPGEDDEADARRAGALLATLRAAAGSPPAAVPDGARELEWRFGRARRWIDEGRASAPVSRAKLDGAARDAVELHRTAPRALCHGDFLDKNILLARDRRWRAIDPMPCAGDPCLDAGFWALHHRPGVAVRERCVRVAAAAGLDGGRVWRWARAFAATEAVLDVDGERARGHVRTLDG